MRLACLLPILLLAACDDPRFERAHLEIDPEHDYTWLYISGDVAPPCPSLPYETTEVTLDGARGGIYTLGGEDCDPGVCYNRCVDVEVGWSHIPDAPFELRVDAPDVRFAFGTDWEPITVTTADDLRAAAASGGELTITWTPADATLASTNVWQAGPEPETLALEELEREPGRARFRFVGDAAGRAFEVAGRIELWREVTPCEGLDECIVSADVIYHLGPDGPITD